MKEETETIWLCPYCDKEYESYDLALDCAKDCVDIEEPEEKDVTTYICELCNSKSLDEEEIEQCEKRHKDRNDVIYQKHLEKQQDDYLLKIGNHPSQTKLI